ncbi:MAG: hypothetical protein WAP47_18835 [Candidatus Rokuibacteriota bacterium]
MKFKSALVTAASGSIHGMTASHNRGGQYLRARTIPTNPQTAFQVAVRDYLALLTSAWSQTLTALQRQGWDDYGDAVEVTDALGEKRKLTGLNWYIAGNVPRLQAGLARVDAAPGVLTMAELSAVAITSFTASTRILIATYVNTDDWAITTGGGLAFFVSRPQSPGVTFFKGPYRFLGIVLGNTATPPTSPFTSTAGPFPVMAGSNIFIQARALNADGRISSPFRVSKISV